MYSLPFKLTTKPRLIDWPSCTDWICAPWWPKPRVAQAQGCKKKYHPLVMGSLSRMQVPSQNCHNWHLHAEMPRSMKLSVLRTWRTIFTRIQISTLQNKSVRVNVGAWSVAHKTRPYLLAGSNLWESQDLPSSLAACTVNPFHKDIQPNPVYLHVSICKHKYLNIYI